MGLYDPFLVNLDEFRWLIMVNLFEATLGIRLLRENKQTFGYIACGKTAPSAKIKYAPSLKTLA